MPEIRRRLLDRRRYGKTRSAGKRGASFAVFEGMQGSLSAAEIEDLLRTEVIARPGCHAEGRTYVVPVTYAYDGDALLIHLFEKTGRFERR